jgi:hypothetical protein
MGYRSSLPLPFLVFSATSGSFDRVAVLYLCVLSKGPPLAALPEVELDGG